MENIVLGLLMLQSMTIYQLNQAFGMGLSMIYAASYGNLQYAVKKLLDAEMISFEEKVENGRNKKIYNINKSGVDEFFRWMMDDADPRHIETVMLSKVYFMGLIEKDDDKIEIIDKILYAAQGYADQLTHAKSIFDKMEISASDMRIAKYQFATLDYGIGAHDFAIGWLKKLKQDIKNNGEEK
ncbi:MAG: PadR family transcriptional regulator [Eubacteriales bacterium]